MLDRAAHIRSEADRFGQLCATTSPGTAVPTCPGWTSLDLLQHLTEVHDMWAAVIGCRLTGEEVETYLEQRAPLPIELDVLLGLRADATDRLLAALESREPTEEAWSWFPPDQSVDFTWRMQTHEATIHRVDAELTAGEPIGTIEPDVAGDGIDHVVDVMWNWAPPDAERTTTGVLELQATDTGRRWLVETYRWSGSAWGQSFTDQPAAGRATAGSPTATLTGSAEDLDLLLWSRADRNITRDGDEEALAALRAVLDDGIQ